MAGAALDDKQVRAIGRALLDWYGKYRRELPWRRSLEPYPVWVSEMMLQQTQVATVVPYFERWMERFPNVAALASAAESDVLHAWQGLGYYSRARNLQRAAVEIVARHAGRIPDNVEALRALPGIGPYSAGAIASIAYGKREPLVDGNVVRVLTRLFALRGDPGRAPLKQAVWAHARALVPEVSAGDFNQALMELGATVCTPRAPRCEDCPLNGECRARELGLVEALPELAARVKTTAVHMVAAVAYRGGQVLVGKLRADAPRWAGMWLFPNAEVAGRETPEAAAGRALLATVGLRGVPSGILCAVRHAVTRFRITLDAYRIRELCGEAKPVSVAEVRWVATGDLPTLAMPTAHRRIATHLLDAAP